nr:MAG TPA: hypothetical protein [Caudoviricetes sp.]
MSFGGKFQKFRVEVIHHAIWSFDSVILNPQILKVLLGIDRCKASLMPCFIFGNHVCSEQGFHAHPHTLDLVQKVLKTCKQQGRHTQQAQPLVQVHGYHPPLLSAIWDKSAIHSALKLVWYKDAAFGMVKLVRDKLPVFRVEDAIVYCLDEQIHIRERNLAPVIGFLNRTVICMENRHNLKNEWHGYTGSTFFNFHRHSGCCFIRASHPVDCTDSGGKSRITQRCVHCRTPNLGSRRQFKGEGNTLYILCSAGCIAVDECSCSFLELLYTTVCRSEA